MFIQIFSYNDKLKACKMRKKMKAMTDEMDGGLLFCPSKAKSNGILLSEDAIQQFITRATQDKKKNESS